MMVAFLYRRFRAGACAFATVLSTILFVSSPTFLFAQLRTGSGSRSLYSEPAVRAVVDDIDLSDSDSRKTKNSQEQVQLASCHACDHGSVEAASGGAYVIDGTYASHDSHEANFCCSNGIASTGGFLAGGCDSGCGVGACAGPMVCGEESFFCGAGPLQSLLCRLSIRAEVPLFWRKGHSTPPLVTTSPAGTASDVAGQLGRNTTDILQDGVFGQDVHAGFRITLGTHLDPCQNYGLLFRYWNAGTRADRSLFNSNDFPILARPFLNTSAAPAAQDTQLVAFPGDSIGNVQVVGRSQVYGLDLNLRRMWYADRFTRVDWLCGYQHTLIGDRLSIDSETTVIGNVPPIQGSTIAVSDRFRTENSFHGYTLGFLWNRRVACFQFENTIRLGLGNLRREANIAGSTTTTSGGTTNSINEGLLARGTNSRTVIDNTFVISPEVGINLAWALNPHMDFTIGYNYLMVPKVLQAGELIDPQLRVNLSDPLIGELDPAFRTRESRFWVRTLGLGLQVRY